MTHRVHTILSLLAEDHAPAALRPSILLAVDWPTVAEEAPATGDDSGIACAASGILSGIGGRENLPALTLATLPLLAARLATVAAPLTTTGDKAMAAHADALWGAAAALVGMPTEVREVPLAARDEGALVNTQIINERDRALADIHALRDILKVPEGGNLVDHASAFAERHMRRVDDSTAEAYRVNAENTRLRAQVDRMSAAMREDAPTSAKPRPQPGDVVPWAEVEDGALYHRPGERCPFRMSVGGRVGAMYDADDRDILRMVEGTFGAGDPEFENHTPEHPLTLVARNLGSDPEAWRAAMRIWTAAGNKPPIESSRPR